MLAPWGTPLAKEEILADMAARSAAWDSAIVVMTSNAFAVATLAF